MIIKIMLKKNYKKDMQIAQQKGYQQGYDRGFAYVIETIREILKNPEGKVFIEGVTLKGDHQILEHCLCLGCQTGIRIEPGAKDDEIKNCIIKTV